MAKRTPRSEASDSTTATPPAAKERRARPRAGGEQDRDALDTLAGDAPVAGGGAPTIADTQAARPRPEDIRPPEDTIASNPDVLEANHLSQGDEPSEEAIRERAYQLYLDRGRDHGLHEDDWHRARRELRSRK